ncbi:MAG: hypothetical protein MUF67_11615, partial [Desulfobacterales bacterium]|nr:hypothetical protein [Desulfobacterales bacterium]
WSALGPDGLDQLMGEVGLSILVIGVSGFADEHGKWIACWRGGGKINIGMVHLFWHYIGKQKINILILFGIRNLPPEKWPRRAQKP